LSRTIPFVAIDRGPDGQGVPVHLSEIAARDPDKPAIVMADGGGTVTFGELDRRSLQVARLLDAHGIGTQDRVAIFLPNRPEYFEIAWGAQRHGVYWVPVNWHLTADEVAYIVADSGAQVLFASPETAEVAAAIARTLPDLKAAYLIGGGHPELASYEEAIAAQPAEPMEGETEGITFFYSSGTTGRPKGIRRSHEFPPFGTGLALDFLMAFVFGFNADSRYLCPAPLYHAAPIGFAMGTQRNGGTVVLMPRFDAAECLRAIEGHQITHVQFVPTHFVRMLKLPEAQRLSFGLSSLELVIHAAAPCPADVKRQMIEWLGPKITEYYAGSEGNGITIISSAEWLERPGSVGRPIGAVVHVVGADGQELPVGEDGIIYFEGGKFEYHNDPAKTAGSVNEQGWSTLADIGHLDADGYLYLADRRTDLIISGGVNIYPAEVEEALVMHPAVADVAVIGVPDAEMGQSVLAVVQPAVQPAAAGLDDGLDNGTLDQAALAAELIAHCRTRLASFKCPRSVEFVSELPRLPTGKLLRRRVREDHAERAARAREQA
jgi:long-chain acyl-CoA synthetase